VGRLRDFPVTGRTAVDDRDTLLLDQIREAYGGLYRCDFTGSAYEAHRVTGGPLLTAATPGLLASAIWTDFTAGAS
jgi:hypothetical protein